MDSTIALIPMVLAGVFALVQVVSTLRFARAVRSDQARLETSRSSLRALVLFPIRGADPELEETIRAVLDQDHADHTIRIILDNEVDGSKDIADRISREEERVHVQVLDKSGAGRCSFKNLALMQGLKGAVEEGVPFDVVALVDSDVIPHRGWLRQLVAPLEEEAVGVVTGNRFYLPKEDSWGALCRHIWCSVANVYLYQFQLLWGGSLAMERALVEESELLQLWAKALCDDIPLARVAKKEQRGIRVRPALTLMSYDDSTLAQTFGWMTRQLVLTRLYHPSFSSIALYAALVTGTLLANLVLLVWSSASGNMVSAAYSLLGLLFFMLGLVHAVTPTQRLVSEASGDKPASILRWRLLLTTFLVQTLHFAAVLRALFRRTEEWRSVTYRVKGPFDIEVVKDDVDQLQKRVGRKERF